MANSKWNWKNTSRRRDNCLKALSLVSMENAVKLSTHLFWYLCMVENCHAGGGHYRLARCNAIRLFSFRPHERGFKKQTLCQWRGSKNCSDDVAQRIVIQNFTRQGYMLSFEGGTLILRETLTMFRSRDVIRRGAALFWSMIHVPVSLIIPVQKKKALLFFIYPCVYIYIYVCVCVYIYSSDNRTLQYT